MENINLNNYEAYFLDYLEGNLSLEATGDLLLFLEAHPELKEELEIDLDELRLSVSEAHLPSKDLLKRDEFDLSIESIDELIVADLEGDLSAKQHDELMSFIALHQLEDVYQTHRKVKLIPSQEEKISSELLLSSLTIEASTIDDVLIARTEGLLTSFEDKLVDTYVAEHSLQAKLKAYQATYLHADITEVFEDKASLKQRGGVVVPLYARIAMGAAAVIAVIFMLQTNEVTNPVLEAGVEIEKPQYYTEKQLAGQLSVKNIEQQEDKLQNSHVNLAPNNLPNRFDVADVKNDSAKVPLKINKHQDKLPLIDEQNIVRHEDSLRSTPIMKHNDLKDVHDDVAVILPKKDNYVTDEPVKIITDWASNTFNRDVSFERKKNKSTEEYVAYHLKLGKFEFERKKAR